ncbi:LysE family transporter [Pectinatus haikarae]|uniref:Cysteine/O-acetylserine efflux protein n=1 Tax=Pectinatus haikarae TaxID=349096 RepID=A0ABT9YAL0_9FIRM|nr:LysE family transporter [Pectinatus haikarae]MDQ0204759.1 cysteine/O-acetylserine efflux protein [Pectinatus haikarae]
MTYSVWLSFFSYTIISAISPGPNNILALNAAGKSGIKMQRRLLSGIYLGFFCIMIICGVFSTVLAVILPEITDYMKYAGAVYITWLAYHVATGRPLKENNTETEKSSFNRGFLLQFVNVKIIIWGLTAFTGFVLPYYDSPIIIVGFIFLLSFIGNGSTHIWAVAGVGLGSLLKKYWRSANIIMGLSLLYSAVNLVL